ncbi:D123-domain-containing protein [Basidiobolus meristosporus CBS 931.73]|uniref:D123-domain-containing protein n=1 Tax=Basidiobolus meristosporus CBS 931.73 TaxID=1314790 RepID=A0A1Y1Z7T4_9FUNG|nr:D123-domain-containing protein [Basidiobolus meristosporus CBS 931.73]|eukprot:ORY06330.1 D123-domain-containing protein [Basidiobolus meristosporus CBS 931.73]
MNPQPEGEAEVVTLEFPELTKEQIIRCSFSSWYPKFIRHTLKTRVIKPLPEGFVKYLLSDGALYIPGGGDITYLDGEDPLSDYSDEEADQEEDSKNDDCSVLENDISFPLLEERIRCIIDYLDGAVFPKLNWSSPKDAAWISASRTLKCTSPYDVFLLLKSSDFVVHDLCHAFEHCVDNEPKPEHEPSLGPEEYELVLRKWYNLHPAMEFRCFVKDGELIAISQRHAEYYEFLAELKDDIEEWIWNFFENEVQENFESQNYVFDVYVNKRTKKVWVLDFNPFHSITEPILFEWAEILTAKEALPLRLITSEADPLIRTSQPHSHNRYPQEMVEMSFEQSLADFAESFQKQFEEQ